MKSHGTCRNHPCSLEPLLELSARQEAEGLGDAPWPPHYAKRAGEPPRVQPSKAKDAARAGGGRRVSSKPMFEIARASRKEDALAGVERWKARHPEAAAHLQPADMLVDSMRGRSSTWTRVRINLEHVPEGAAAGAGAAGPGRRAGSRAGAGVGTTGSSRPPLTRMPTR